MAYDEDLADRIRELVAGEPGLREMKAFGGLAFLIRGNMAVAASGQGGLMVRVDPAASESLAAKGDAAYFEMGGRTMKGWLHVDLKHLGTKRQLQRWVARGIDIAITLPAKK